MHKGRDETCCRIGGDDGVGVYLEKEFIVGWVDTNDVVALMEYLKF